MKLKSLLLSLFFVLATTLSFSQVLTFKVQSATYNGTYGPDHVLAIWITDGTGKFVKTIDIHAKSRIQYLYNWIASSAKNVVGTTTADGTSGASLTAHAAVTKTWNCTNVSGAVVPDGNYNINIEYTEDDATSKTDSRLKYMSYPFTIGAASSVTVPNATSGAGLYYKSVSYSTTISAQTPINEAKAGQVYNICYQPNAKVLQVKYDAQMHHGVVAKIFDAKGALVSQQDMPEGSSSIVLSNLSKGVYLIKFVDAKGTIETKRFVAQ
ncbi:MAG: DUF2271 domain-containing protein [Bacteroidales bacterium]